MPDDHGSGWSEYAAALVAALDAEVPGWVVGLIERCAGALCEVDLDAATACGERVRAEVIERLSALLAEDVDHQRASPLSLIRLSVAHPNALLRSWGVPEPVRGRFDRDAFADDSYGLSPAAWSDIGERVHEAGIIWGAWKAKTVIDRRRMKSDG